jgi:tetratricopeptide (TPR) repeat protein
MCPAYSSVRAVFGALFLASAAVLAAAAPEERAALWPQCWNKESTPADKIAACSALIDAQRENKSNLAIAFGARGAAYAALGDHDKAIADFDQAIKLSPRAATTYAGRADSLLAKSEAANVDRLTAKRYIGRAIEDFSQALLLDSKLVEAIIGRGKTFMKNDEADRAVPDFDRAIRLDPNNADLFRYRGLGYRQLGDYDKAIFDYSSAIRLDPQDAKTYIDRGAVFYVKTYYYRALEDFDTALKLDPNYVQSLYGRGMARQKLGDAEGAADVAAAVAKQPNIAAVMAAAGVK